MAITFGQGRHLLNPSSYEENFGLLTSLNSIDPKRIRTLDRKRFDAISRLTREQASHEVPIFDFGLELEQDVLRSLTGLPTDERLGKRLSGRDSLSAAVPTELGDLPTLLDLYLGKARGKGYKQKFPGIDSIEEMRDETLLQSLEAKLLNKLKTSDFSRLWLVIPDLLDWTDVEGFTYSRAQSAEMYSDIHISTYLDQVKDLDSLSIDYLRRHRVLCISASTSTVLNEWSVYKCIYAELDDAAGTFLLDNGNWYRIDTDLVNQVDREIKRIAGTSLELPKYEQGETEEVFNARFASLNRTFMR